MPNALNTSHPNRPARVCFVIDDLATGGTELQLLSLIRHLDRSKVAPYLCLLRSHREGARCLEPECCPVMRLSVGSLRHTRIVAKAMQFVRFLRREHIQILQVFFPDSTLFAVPLAKLAGVPHVVRTQRNLGSWMRRRERWLAWIYGRFSVATLANCEACREATVAHERVAAESVVVLKNGVDLERFAHMPPVAPPTDGRPCRVGMVGNLRPIKGPDVFVEAAAILGSARPNTVFRIAGSGVEDEKKSVSRLIEKSSLQDRCHLLGSVDDIPSFLGSLDVAVVPSRSEGLSNALLEYMAAGRPIVATTVGGNVELIEDGIHGLLVPPNDPQAVADAIDRLLRDPGLAARLGAAARDRATQEYSMEAMTAKHEAFYMGLVDGRR